jgi:acetoin utilization deacetylase AcuC-like enzyme/GNAT superfamily N-acetyltransferase
MLRIRRIYDDFVPANRERLAQVQEILRRRFSDISETEIVMIGEKLRNPFKQRFRLVLFVAESIRRKVLGFAALLHEPEIGFAFLDWLAAASGRAGGGIGGALYDRVRQEAKSLNVKGLFFECLPDTVEACPDAALLAENRSRLRFYERYGARPVINTGYEMPVKEGDTCMPHLVYDGLDAQLPLRRSFARKVVRAILERKYAEYCPPEYVDRVTASFAEDPVSLRPFRYVKPAAVRASVEGRSTDQIALIINPRHEIHHVHERGYVESPVRVRSILSELEPSGLFTPIAPRPFADSHLHAVHDPAFVSYLRKACADLPPGKSLYPYIFPIRNKTRPPREPSVLSGYYCIDTFTPINANVWSAARGAVDCALTAAGEVLNGRRIAYALVRPPGHHAERRSYGGFCYFNNCAAAAQYLSTWGKTAILDLDYHHGNGQQDIFYQRADVLTVSIHGHPSFAYPYFSGFADEKGDGEGEGFNLNLPLPEQTDGGQYLKALDLAVRRIRDFNPHFLVTALGFDPARGDPTGTWSLRAGDFEENGRRIGAMGIPTVVVQEGGYRTRTIGRNALRFFKGLSAGFEKWANSRHDPRERLHGVQYRHEPGEADLKRVRKLVEITGFFNPAEIDIAEELVRERLLKGDDSGYYFIFAEHFGRLAGYVCYGPIPATAAAYDLYWIAVHPDFQGRSLGRRLLKEMQSLVAKAGGGRIYADTSQRLQYASTRAFYESCGFTLETVLRDFYAPGDGKAIYCKSLV